jgi:hypothetical protein
MQRGRNKTQHTLPLTIQTMALYKPIMNDGRQVLASAPITPLRETQEQFCTAAGRQAGRHNKRNCVSVLMVTAEHADFKFPSTSAQKTARCEY